MQLRAIDDVLRDRVLQRQAADLRDLLREVTDIIRVRARGGHRRDGAHEDDSPPHAAEHSACLADRTRCGCAGTRREVARGCSVALRLLWMRGHVEQDRWSLAVLALSASASADTLDADKTLSPYFFVEGANPASRRCRSRARNADVHITRRDRRCVGDADVQERRGSNDQRPLCIPGVDARRGLRHEDEDRRARHRGQDQGARGARKAEYEEAKAAGKTASLLEEDRPNVFSMNVANILPKDRIEVELHYTELLVPTDGTYELVYPHVVGPRYVERDAAKHGRTTSSCTPRYTHAGAAPSYGVRHQRLDRGAAWRSTASTSPSHAIKTAWAREPHERERRRSIDGAATRQQGLRPALPARRRRHRARACCSFPGAKENFFLMMVQPPHRPALEQIPPREYVFILDVSGSMHGFPLDTAKALMRDLLGAAAPDRHASTSCCSRAARACSRRESVAATKDKIDDAIAFIGQRAARRRRHRAPARAAARDEAAAQREGMSRSFVVVTDGYIAEEPAMFDHVRDAPRRRQRVRVRHRQRRSTATSSRASRRPARASRSSCSTEQARPRRRPRSSRAYVESPVLTQVAGRVRRLRRLRRPAARCCPTCSRSARCRVRQVQRHAEPARSRSPACRARAGSSARSTRRTVDARRGNAALSYLWARAEDQRALGLLSGDANKQAVVELGLQYNLLTQVHLVHRGRSRSSARRLARRTSTSRCRCPPASATSRSAWKSVPSPACSILLAPRRPRLHPDQLRLAPEDGVKLRGLRGLTRVQLAASRWPCSRSSSARSTTARRPRRTCAGSSRRPRSWCRCVTGGHFTYEAGAGWVDRDLSS